ncbi:MAG: hypothetical protein DU429_05200 [Candidatus Tokpelaia sp.]|uniref:hypothetical protein n=1 Tax=Candidatus Tokpelaia sp. TaxID=2233777 RepID=UPI0012387573|nr:hypothetical protein [Candidatus Tokpelaia sp.]KAA6204554.1 MAG: hypothetical protein DU430_07850 [Candidatus Tokpelaia sp.]KAA6206859.1 MAG: hypothetical protein DU429_05200 [Candidatus Tokpelaia sp.]KAA6404619.1 hypothetical protein DPQ22_09060 [Candidatus Tokpelaia sp.]
MAATANIEIDLSNGETVAGSISPGYRLIIATNEGSSNIFSLNKWDENYPVIAGDNFCLEYYRQTNTTSIVKMTPCNISGKFSLRIASSVPGIMVMPAGMVLSPANKSPLLFRISSARADFVMSISTMIDNRIDSSVPVINIQSQKQEEDYRLVINLPDSRFSKQYVVTVPDDGQGHMLSQGNAPMVRLPYYAATATGDYNWKL